MDEEFEQELCVQMEDVDAVFSFNFYPLIARNCHKSVYHGAYLRNLELQYLYPKVSEQFGFALGTDPESVEEKLKADGKIGAVLITSPTYEGVISDIEKIAEINRKEN